MVHKGFMDAWNAIRDDLLAEVLSRNPATVHVTGHSMGGALSNLCAYELAAVHHKDIVMYTFAQPRGALPAAAPE
jgi:predicted lipase